MTRERHKMHTDPPIVLRAASASDLPLVFKLEREYIARFEPKSMKRWQVGIDRHLEQWVSNLTRMFVAEFAAKAVGYCFWEINGDEAVLASISVLTDYRLRGVGASLLRRFEDDAMRHGKKLLILGVVKQNPARYLYESAGYVFARQDETYCYYEKVILAFQNTSLSTES